MAFRGGDNTRLRSTVDIDGELQGSLGHLNKRVVFEASSSFGSDLCAYCVFFYARHVIVMFFLYIIIKLDVLPIAIQIHKKRK